MGINRKRKDCSATPEYLERFDKIKWEKKKPKKSGAANRKTK